MRKLAVGRPEYTTSANLQDAYKVARVGDVVELPNGDSFRRIDARKDPDKSAWVLIRNNAPPI